MLYSLWRRVISHLGN